MVQTGLLEKDEPKSFYQFFKGAAGAATPGDGAAAAGGERGEGVANEKSTRKSLRMSMKKTEEDLR